MRKIPVSGFTEEQAAALAEEMDSIRFALAAEPSMTGRRAA